MRWMAAGLWVLVVRVRRSVRATASVVMAARVGSVRVMVWLCRVVIGSVSAFGRGVEAVQRGGWAVIL